MVRPIQQHLLIQNLLLLHLVTTWTLPVNTHKGYEEDALSPNEKRATKMKANQTRTLEYDPVDYDLTRHVRQFNFTLSDSSLCGSDLFLVIVVMSAPQNVRARQAIRNTWGEQTDEVQVVFLLGQLKRNNPALSGQIQQEYKKYHDIVQMDVIDDYKNLTLKTIAMLQWLDGFCKYARYILKTDDDMFINVPVLIRDLKNTVHTRFLMGHMIAGAQPIRDLDSKYYCPEAVYPEPMYPVYLSGTAYVISGDLISDFLHLTYHVRRIFHLEDVFLTGFCAAALPDVEHIFNGKFGFRPRVRDPCLFELIVTAHEMTPDDLIYMWQQMKYTDKEVDCTETRISTGNIV